MLERTNALAKVQFAQSVLEVPGGAFFSCANSEVGGRVAARQAMAPPGGAICAFCVENTVWPCLTEVQKLAVFVRYSRVSVYNNLTYARRRQVAFSIPAISRLVWPSTQQSSPLKLPRLPKRRALTHLERHEICKRRLEPGDVKKTLIEPVKQFPDKPLGKIKTWARLEH